MPFTITNKESILLISGVNNEYRKSFVFKFVLVNQAIIFNADRITHTFKNVFETDYELQYSENYPASRQK